MPKEGIAQFFAFSGFIELSYNKSFGEPGNYGKGFLGLGSVGFSATCRDPDVRDKKLRAEMANGRLAMVSIIGMFFPGVLDASHRSPEVPQCETGFAVAQSEVVYNN